MKRVVIIIFFLSLLQVCFGLSHVLAQRQLIDFQVYYQAAKSALNGINPYTRTFGENIPFNYPPSAILFFLPMTFLPIASSQVVWTFFSIFFFITSVLILTDLNKSTRNPIIRFLVLSALLQNFPTKFTLVLGQANFMVLLFVVLAFAADQRKRFGYAGLFYGLAIMLKLTPITLGIYFLIRRRFKPFVIGLGIAIISNILMVKLIGGTDIFFKNVLPALISFKNGTTSLYDQSIYAFFYRLGLGMSALELSYLTVLLLFAIVIWKYKKYDDLVLFSLILAITTIGNSFTWQHHLVFLFPAFIAEMIYFLNSIKESLFILKTGDASAGSPKRAAARSRLAGEGEHALGLASGRTRKLILRGLLLLLSAVLVGYHFPDIAHPPTANPILLSHSLAGAVILIILLLIHTGKLTRIETRRNQR